MMKENIRFNFWKLECLRTTDDVMLQDLCLPLDFFPKAIECYAKPITLMPVEEHKSIVSILIKALENECCCPGENRWADNTPILCDACEALENYKKQTGVKDET